MDAFPSSSHVAPIAFSDADGNEMELLCIWHSTPDNDSRIIAAGNDSYDSFETNEETLSTCAYKRVEDMLARQEQDQLIVTLPDSPTVVSLRRDALSVPLEILPYCLHSTISLAASQEGCEECPFSMSACAGCGTRHCSGGTQAAVWDMFRPVRR